MAIGRAAMWRTLWAQKCDRVSRAAAEAQECHRILLDGRAVNSFAATILAIERSRGVSTPRKYGELMLHIRRARARRTSSVLEQENAILNNIPQMNASIWCGNDW